MTSSHGLQARRDSAMGEEEFDEADMWGQGGADDEDASQCFSGEEEKEEEEEVAVQEDGFGVATRRYEVFQPVTTNPMVGSLPNWKSSLPRPIMHPKAVAAAAAAAATVAATVADGDGGDVKDGLDMTSAAASLPDPGPGFIPPHIYASTYSTYSSTSGGGFMDAFLNGNGQGINGGGGIGSCISGRGHTLKGRDALKVRTAILRQTGFVEPNTPGPARDLEPRTSTPAIVVAGDVAGRETFQDVRSP